MTNRAHLTTTQRWVVKIGSSSLTNHGKGLDTQAIERWVQQCVALRQQGVELVLVSSGAVAEGMRRLGWSQRPNTIHELQAAAAVGQMGLVQAYESCFAKQNLHTAQILLTHEDLSNRRRYLNARTSLKTLLALGVIPVVNENDTVATDEIRFGDNDRLAALVANLIEADVLIILTDQAGMYDADPRGNPQAKLLSEVQASDPNLLGMASGTSGQLGRGGMTTKVQSAALAARSGAYTVVVGSHEPQVLVRLHQGENVGTLFIPDQQPIAARKQWLASHLQMRGQLILDAGAVKKLRESGSSLLAVGVKQVQGEFKRGDMVECVNEAGEKIASGLVNYDAQETRLIAGKPSQQIESLLGYVDEAELIHRDNMVVF